jgi:hypothetical protein
MERRKNISVQTHAWRGNIGFPAVWKDPILATKAMKKTAYGDAVV